MNSTEDNYILSYSGLEIEEALQSAYTVGEDIHDIKQGIREIKSAMSVNGDLWDNIQDCGHRNDYTYCFRNWGGAYIQPKYIVKPYRINPSNNGGSANSMFANASRLMEIRKNDFNLGGLPTNATAVDICKGCTRLVLFEDINLNAPSSYQRAWKDCNNLITIENIRSSTTTTWTDAFDGCNSLQNLQIEGVIGKAIDITEATNLTEASLQSIKNALSSESPSTITMSQFSFDKLGEANIVEITQDKKWSVAIK